MTVNMVISWLVVMAFLIAIELATMGLTTIWFACGALAAAVAAAFDVVFWVQVVLFILVSFAVLLAVRPVAVKYFNKDRTLTNIESMIGRQAVVISEIDNLQSVGQVNVGGMEWSARSVSDDIDIPVGRIVIIRNVDGVKLIVEEKKVKEKDPDNTDTSVMEENSIEKNSIENNK